MERLIVSMMCLNGAAHSQYDVSEWNGSWSQTHHPDYEPLHSDTSYWLWATPFRHTILTMSCSIQTHHTDYEPLHSDTSYWLWAAPIRHIILTMSRSNQTHHTDYEPLHSETSYWLWATPFRHIILTMSRSIQTHHTDYEPSFYSYSSKLTVEALNIIIIIFDLTRTKDPTHDLQYLKRLRYLLHRQGQYSKVNVR
jgi:cytochrome c-type biogenesis protein CcmH/NrfF